MGRGTHRGFITYEELNKSLGKRNLSNENFVSRAPKQLIDQNTRCTMAVSKKVQKHGRTMVVLRDI